MRVCEFPPVSASLISYFQIYVLTNRSPAMQQYYTQLLQMILEKLDKSKSDAFHSRFTRFYHLISAKADDGLGADFFIRLIDAIGSG